MLLTDADQLREALAIALRERDEARAEIERFRNAVREKERLELAALQELDEARAALRIVAERQREACAAAVDAHGIRSEWGTVVRATPLVTEGGK